MTVDLYFDFISPYSWLALVRTPKLIEEYEIEIRLRPVVYGALLSATGLIGPAEQPAKRRYMYVDVLRAARAAGRPFVGPPAHPFRSMEALRLVTSELHDPTSAHHLAITLATACWEQGQDLADIGVLSELAAHGGIDADSCKERLTRTAIKQQLRETTDNALAAGVFGVPTFAYHGELFWGHDRIDALTDALTGKWPTIDTASVQDKLDRPSGIDRRS